jgi:hypothetical protein
MHHFFLLFNSAYACTIIPSCIYNSNVNYDDKLDFYTMQYKI